LEPVAAGPAGRPSEEPVTTTRQSAMPRPADPAADRTSDPIDAPAEGDKPVLVEDELLVEDVSIDGMCGVY
jgi:mycofactocin precursor